MGVTGTREDDGGSVASLDGPAASRRHSGRRGLASAAVGLLLVGGCLAVVPLVLIRGICAFLPCDPGVGSAGFVDAGGGLVGIELGPVTARAVELIEVRGIPSGADSDGELLWQIRRSGDVPDDWNGSIVVGEVPAGFAETRSLRTPLPDAWTVSVRNECYGGFPERLPTARLEQDRVTYEDGFRESVESVRTESYGLSSCEPEPSARALGAMRAGFVLGSVGCLLLIVVIGSSFVERRRSPSP